MMASYVYNAGERHRFVLDNETKKYKCTTESLTESELETVETYTSTNTLRLETYGYMGLSNNGLTNSEPSFNQADREPFNESGTNVYEGQDIDKNELAVKRS